MKRRTAIKSAVASVAAGGGAGLGAARPVRAPKRGIQGAAQAGLGSQLSSRVSSGAITQEQAQQVAGQRSLLKRAYGADWRTKVYGDRGYIKRTRQALAKDPSDPQVSALNTALMEARKSALERAKAKLAGR